MNRFAWPAAVLVAATAMAPGGCVSSDRPRTPDSFDPTAPPGVTIMVRGVT